MVGEIPSVTGEFVGRWARAKQASCIVPPLAPPPQAVQLKIIWDNLKRSNIQIIGVPEGEEQQQEIENLFEQIMKEDFPNLAKEINFQEVQEAQRVPKKLSPKRNTPRYIIIKLPKIKDKEKTLKAARGKERVTYKGVSIGYQLTSQKKPCRQEGAGKKYSNS